MENFKITEAQIKSLLVVRKGLIEAYNDGAAINFTIVRELDETIESLLKENSLN